MSKTHNVNDNDTDNVNDGKACLKTHNANDVDNDNVNDGKAWSETHYVNDNDNNNVNDIVNVNDNVNDNNKQRTILLYDEDSDDSDDHIIFSRTKQKNKLCLQCIC